MRPGPPPPPRPARSQLHFLLSPSVARCVVQAEEHARVHAQQATLHKAATMLQKMWRGRNARRDLERKKGGGKKGKGGKGKKKK